MTYIHPGSGTLLEDYHSDHFATKVTGRVEDRKKEGMDGWMNY
jgi:hypothetical protein